MAPQWRQTASGDRDHSDSFLGLSGPSGQNEADDPQNEAATLTMKGKVALCAGLMASDGLSVFGNLNEMPLQQALGTPVHLVTLPGALSASAALVLMPLMGRCADGGSRPQHRKRPVTLAAFGVAVLGLCLTMSATLLSGGTFTEGKGNRTAVARSFSFESDSDDVMHEVTNSTSGQVYNSILELPLPAKLSMAGFVFMDLGFDVTNSAVKTLMLTHSEPADHVSLLVTGVVMAALGGCTSSVSGLIDLGGVLPNLSPICSQATLQLAILLVLSVLSCTCSILTASRRSSPPRFPDDPLTAHDGQQKRKKEEDEKEEGGEEEKDMPSMRFSREVSENVFAADSTPHGEAIMSMSAQLEASFRGLSISTTLAHSHILQSLRTDEEKTPLLQGNSDYNVIPGDVEGTTNGNFRNNRKFKLLVLWMVAFFSGSCIFTFNVTLADYVGKIIYGGSPHADPNSMEFLLYQEGLHKAALCIVIVNIAFVTSALCQNKILAAIGPKTEYLGLTVVLMLLLLIMRQTSSLWAVYVTAAVMGLNRSAFFTVPFVLATRLCCHQPALTGHSSPAQPDKDNGSLFGTTMALMTSAVPSAYLVINAIIGPLVDATGDPSAPMLMAIVCSLLAALTVCCYKS
ncbi:hypothetical protein ACOMHN_002302 [Nucella lapillus]